MTETVRIIHEKEAVGIGSTIFRGAHLLYYKKPDDILYFDFRNVLYNDPKKNVWSAYLKQPFEHKKQFIIDQYNSKAATLEYGIFNNKNEPFLFCYGAEQKNGADFANKERVQEFRNKLRPYLIFKQHIIDKVNTFIDSNFSNKKVLSIHKRGTDLFSDTGHAKNQEHLFDYDFIKNRVNKIIGNYDAIFLATDEQETLDKFKYEYGSKILTYATTRAERGNKAGLHISSIYKSPEKKYILGEEAIIDTILMSKCDYSFCVRSNLSLLNIILRDDFNYEFIDDHIDYGNLG
jgi:hypothetical protein